MVDHPARPDRAPSACSARPSPPTAGTRSARSACSPSPSTSASRWSSLVVYPVLLRINGLSVQAVLLRCAGPRSRWPSSRAPRSAPCRSPSGSPSATSACRGLRVLRGAARRHHEDGRLRLDLPGDLGDLRRAVLRPRPRPHRLPADRLRRGHRLGGHRRCHRRDRHADPHAVHPRPAAGGRRPAAGHRPDPRHGPHRHQRGRPGAGAGARRQARGHPRPRRRTTPRGAARRGRTRSRTRSWRPPGPPPSSTRPPRRPLRRSPSRPGPSPARVVAFPDVPARVVAPSTTSPATSDQNAAPMPTKVTPLGGHDEGHHGGHPGLRPGERGAQRAGQRAEQREPRHRGDHLDRTGRDDPGESGGQEAEDQVAPAGRVRRAPPFAGVRVGVRGGHQRRGDGREVDGVPARRRPRQGAQPGDGHRLPPRHRVAVGGEHGGAGDVLDVIVTTYRGSARESTAATVSEGTVASRRGSRLIPAPPSSATATARVTSATTNAPGTAHRGNQRRSTSQVRTAGATRTGCSASPRTGARHRSSSTPASIAVATGAGIRAISVPSHGSAR